MNSRSVLTPDADRVMRFAGVVFTTIAGGSAGTLVVAGILQWLRPELVTWVVWLRAAAYTVGGLWLLALVRRTRERADRGAFVRIRLISVLAPLGIAALVVSPDSGYPGWMKVEQAVFGLLLFPLAVALVRPAVAASFPKTLSRSLKARHRSRPADIAERPGS